MSANDSPRLPTNLLARSFAAASIAALVAACGSENSQPGPPDEDAGADASVDVDAGDDTADPDATPCVDGTAGCPCLDGDTCSSDDLVCTDGTCVESACNPGDTGCACVGGNACTDPADACVDGVCTPREGCDGELGCRCTTDSCDSGLSCEGGYCRSPQSVLVRIEGDALRACDILLELPARASEAAAFVGGYRGRFRQQGALISLSVIPTADVDLNGVIAAVILEGDASASADDVGGISATCYDRFGNLEADAVPSVE